MSKARDPFGFAAAINPESEWDQEAIAKLSWAPEVFLEGKWAGNALRFATEAEALESGAELLSRWWVPTDHRAVVSSDPVNYRMADGRPERIET